MNNRTASLLRCVLLVFGLGIAPLPSAGGNALFDDQYGQWLVSRFSAQAAELSAALPQRLDDYTTLVGVSLGQSEIEYRYALDVDAVSADSWSTFGKQLHDQHRAATCGNPMLRDLMVYGYRTLRVYVADGRPDLRLTVTAADCGVHAQ